MDDAVEDTAMSLGYESQEDYFAECLTDPAEVERRLDALLEKGAPDADAR